MVQLVLHSVLPMPRDQTISLPEYSFLCQTLQPFMLLILVMMTHMYTRMCFRSSLSLGDVDSQYWLGIDEQHSPGVWRWITGFPATWIG